MVLCLNISYFDQNEDFSSCLPIDCWGSVERQMKFSDSEGPWYLVALNKPVSYEGTSYTRFLLMSRWADYPIGGNDPTSVFILLVPPTAEPASSDSLKQFVHVAWGMVSARSA